MKKRKTHFKQVPLEVVRKIAIEEATKETLVKPKPSHESAKKKSLVHSWGLPAPQTRENNL
jgi:hypothetical protein